MCIVTALPVLLVHVCPSTHDQPNDLQMTAFSSHVQGSVPIPVEERGEVGQRQKFSRNAA